LLGLTILWTFTGFLSVGVIGLNFLYTKKKALSDWKIDKDPLYLPKISIIIPTFNEEKIIEYKIRNMMKVEYPLNLIEFIFVDSLSNDSTLKIINEITSYYSDRNIKILIDTEKRGKSNALNLALKQCDCEIVVISDADCFLSFKSLIAAVSYFHDNGIGAVTGPKRLLNNESSWVTKSEENYLNSMNLMKLGDSKIGSTIFFEGGFSAFRRNIIDSFDPYDTGSDDCGTVISVLEKNYRAIMLPEAEFFTTFPNAFKQKISVKIRRSSQLLSILQIYLFNILHNKIQKSRFIILKNIMLYLFGPFIFMIFAISTIFLLFKIPLLSFLFLFLLIPKAREYSFELIFGYLIFFFSFFILLLGRKFLHWEKPEDRKFFTKKDLIEKNLI
jgi:cellulose synthase/poly-beta-1,6-N-acetylglucosamine synthase-like glycosyltransferase